MAPRRPGSPGTRTRLAEAYDRWRERHPETFDSPFERDRRAYRASDRHRRERALRTDPFAIRDRRARSAQVHRYLSLRIDALGRPSRTEEARALKRALPD